MKVRIANNSIRLRLKQPEVRKFGQQESIYEKLEMGMESSAQLCFILSASAGEEPSFNFQQNMIIINIPNAIARQWATTEQVGIEHEWQIGEGKTLKILIEKDFACLDASEDENIDTYPNPKAVC